MRLTLLLAAVCLAVFAYTATLDAAGEKAFVETYGFSGANALQRPQVLVTSIFIHADLMHLLSNVFALLFFGMAVEAELGSRRTLLLFLGGAVLGDVLSLLVYPFDALTVGASAGIFALIGAGMLVRPIDLSFYPLIVPVPLALLGVMYALYTTYAFIVEPAGQVSYIGHLGGFALGLWFGTRVVGFKQSVVTIALALGAVLLLPAVLNVLGFTLPAVG